MFRLKISLLLLRYGIALVFIVWSLDKLLNTTRTKEFYPGLSLDTTVVMGMLEIILVLAFLLGLYKSYSYAIVLIMHTVSTFLPWQYYLQPFIAKTNLLYFTAWPMLAACIAIYLLRQQDTLLTISHFRSILRR
ncbi:MAG: hypothetical protein ACC707_11850 [Thiohalomonadales bacterium]